MPPRRELVAALLLDLCGAGLVLLAAGRTWVRLHVTNPAPLPGADVLVSGTRARPVVSALALVGLAGVVALLAVRGAGRVAVGGLLAASGLGAAGAAARAASRPVGAWFGYAPVAAGGSLDPARTAWPWVAVAGGLLMATAGLLAAAGGRRWPALGARYDAPAASALSTAASTGASTASDSWAALDRGEDPTRDGGGPLPTGI